MSIVGISPLSAGGVGGGVEPPTKFSKRGLDRTSTFRVAGKEGGDFFQGEGLQFSHKNKLKSDI